MRWSVSVLTGANSKSKPNLTLLAILPRAGFALHRNWDLEFEGNFSYYGIEGEKNLYLLGINANILLKPFQLEKLTPFLIGGAGLAYNNNNGSVRELGDSHAAGILQGGVGIDFGIKKGWGARGEYRFEHISDPFERDLGFNTHNFSFGLSF